MEMNEKKENGFEKHVCEFRQSSENFLLVNSNIKMRLKRAFHKIIGVSEEHPYTDSYLRSRAAITNEKRKHIYSKHWWIIHPCSKFRFLWDKLMTIILIYFFIAVPYIIAFYRLSGRQLHDQLNFIYPAYAITTIDIFINFITGHIAVDRNAIFIDPNLIARHYMQGYFIIDIITCLPYTWLVTDELIVPYSNNNYFALITEFVPLLTISRMPTLRHNIKKINTSCGFASVTDIIIWLSLLTILIFHWSACLSWAFPFIVLHATRTKIEYSDAYAIRSQLYKDNSEQIYIISLHMGISNLFGSNLIEFQEISFPDKFIRCILLLLGSGYTIYVIVVILQLIESSSEPQLKYQGIIRDVKEYIDENNLPEELANKLILYYKYRFQENYFKEKAIAASLSKHLNEEIKIFSNHELFETATIFHNLPKSFISNIIAVMKSVIHLKNDVIYEAGSDGNCMYFIMSGTVALITPLGKELGHLEDGDCFGESSLLKIEHRREVTAIAAETSELLQLDRRNFNQLIRPDSELFKKLSEMAKNRSSEVNKINQLSKEQIKEQTRKIIQYKRLLLRAGEVDLPVNK